MYASMAYIWYLPSYVADIHECLATLIWLISL